AHTVHMNQPTNQPYALGGLITDTGCDRDRQSPWLRSSCIYDPVRDGALLTAEQTTKYRPLLEAIGRTVEAGRRGPASSPGNCP
ncbi:hypothetical protein, partial [Amycolatopsis lurida]|uniref:hypothetical protein n=1 Tax=Amycolatopsis lurida TaxID=31959 RepID=UPI00365EE8EA